MPDDADVSARAAETVFFKHRFTRVHAQRVGCPYWGGKKDREVDTIADVDGDTPVSSLKAILNAIL